MLSAQQAGGTGTPAPRTAEIAGVVVTDDPTPVAIRRATVTLTDGAATTAHRDDRRRRSVRIHELAAGAFHAVGTKGGYLPATYGARRPGGVGIPVAVAAGERGRHHHPDDQGQRHHRRGDRCRRATGAGRVGQSVPPRVLGVHRGAHVTGRSVRVEPGHGRSRAVPHLGTGGGRVRGVREGPWRWTTSPESVQQIADADVQRANRMLREAGASRATRTRRQRKARRDCPMAFAPVFFRRR